MVKFVKMPSLNHDNNIDISEVEVLPLENTAYDKFKPSTHILLPAVFVHLIAYTMMFAPTQQFLLELLCKNPDGNEDNQNSLSEVHPFQKVCTGTEVQREVSLWTMILAVSTAIPGIYLAIYLSMYLIFYDNYLRFKK